MHSNCTATAPQLHLCTLLHLHSVARRVNTRTSSPLLSPQRLSVSSSMTPGTGARARRVHLDRRLKVPDGERRSGPAPVISCQRPAAAPPTLVGSTSAVYPAGRPCLAVLCSALLCSASSLPVCLCVCVSHCFCAALNQGPLTRYLLSFQMTSLALGPSLAPPLVIRGNKIKNYASSSRCGDLGDQAATYLGGSTTAPHHTTPSQHQHHHHQKGSKPKSLPCTVHPHPLSQGTYSKVEDELTQNPIGLFRAVIQCNLSDLSPAYSHNPLLFSGVYFPFLFPLWRSSM